MGVSCILTRGDVGYCHAGAAQWRLPGWEPCGKAMAFMDVFACYLSQVAMPNARLVTICMRFHAHMAQAPLLMPKFRAKVLAEVQPI